MNIFVGGQARFGSGTNVVLTAGSAANVQWEVQWQGTAGSPYAFVSGGGDWHGSVFTPYGGIHYGNGSESGSVHGYLWSGWDGVVPSGHELVIYIEHSAEVHPPGPPGPPVINVSVVKDVHTAIANEWTWTIDKSVTPDNWNIFKGDSAESTYTVAVKKSLSAQSSYLATGTITVTNNSLIGVLLLSISDIASGQTANIQPPSGQSLPTPVDPILLAPGQAISFTYDVTLPSGAGGQTNRATAKVQANILGSPELDQPSADVPIIFTGAPQVDVNDTVHVTDTFQPAGGSAIVTDLGPVSQDTTFTYSRTFTCANAGDNDDTARIVETNQSDSAKVHVTCNELTVTKTAHTKFTRTYGWTIDKSVAPARWDLFAGDTGTSTYTVSVNKDNGTDSSIVVTGTITITNSTSLDATLTGVSDAMTGGIVATLDPNDVPQFPYKLLAGQSLQIDYSATPPDTTQRTNTATALLQNYAYNYKGEATPIAQPTEFKGTSDVVFGEPATKINDTITVTDSRTGNLGTASDDKTFTPYTVTFDCDDVGSNDNTATIVETDQKDVARVDVYCYQIDVSKTAVGSFTRTWSWEITKTVTPATWAFYEGQSGQSTYTVRVTKGAYADSNFGVTGQIFVHNPAPIAATINSVSDLVAAGVPGVLNVPAGFFPRTVSANSTLTIDYSAFTPTLGIGTSGTNNVTAVQQHYNYKTPNGDVPAGTSSHSAFKGYTFLNPTTLVNNTINVDDSWKGFLGTTSSNQTFNYVRTFDCGDVGTKHNVATIRETGQNASADVTITCLGTPPFDIPGLSIVKTASPICILSDTLVTYTYVVTNTGTTALTNVEISDDKLGVIDTIPSMAPKATVTRTKTATITADTVNIGTAKSVYQGVTLSVSDDASVDVVHPAIEVFKTSDAPAAGRGDRDDRELQLLRPQQRATSPLINVDVVDDKLGVIATGLTLAVNETKVLPSKSAVLEEDTTNKVTATAKDECGNSVSASAQLTVDVYSPFTPPDVKLVKEADGTTFSPGDDITYTLTYTNVGEVPVENFTVVDDYDERYVFVVDAAGGVDNGDTITWTIPGPLAKDESGKITYTMRVRGDVPDGTVIDNTAVVNVNGDVNPANNEDNDTVEVVVEEEEFLPFTGGELGLVIFLAGLATIGGIAFRRMGRIES